MIYVVPDGDETSFVYYLTRVIIAEFCCVLFDIICQLSVTPYHINAVRNVKESLFILVQVGHVTCSHTKSRTTCEQKRIHYI